MNIFNAQHFEDMMESLEITAEVSLGFRVTLPDKPHVQVTLTLEDFCSWVTNTYGLSDAERDSLRKVVEGRYSDLVNYAMEAMGKDINLMLEYWEYGNYNISTYEW